MNEYRRYMHSPKPVPEFRHPTATKSSMADPSQLLSNNVTRGAGIASCYEHPHGPELSFAFLLYLLTQIKLFSSSSSPRQRVSILGHAAFGVLPAHVSLFPGYPTVGLASTSNVDSPGSLHTGAPHGLLVFAPPPGPTPPRPFLL